MHQGLAALPATKLGQSMALGCEMVGMHLHHALVGPVKPNLLMAPFLASWGAGGLAASEFCLHSR